MKSKGTEYLLAVLLYGISIASAKGDAIYSYTGSHFTTVTGSAPAGITSDFITASFTFAGPLGPNLSEASLTPLAWSISDQIDTITSADPAASIVLSFFSTDAMGKIVPTTIFSVFDIHFGRELDMETFNSGGDAVRYSRISGPGAGLIYQASTTQTGVFTLTPEPAAIALGLFGGLVLILGTRRSHGTAS